MNKTINTIKINEDYMLNSLKYSFFNGSLEGINNKIKLIEKVSYGYSSFCTDPIFDRESLFFVFFKKINLSDVFHQSNLVYNPLETFRL